MSAFRLAAIAVAIVAICAAGSAWARVGVTSVTSGDPLGQPPAEQERILRVGTDVQANERITTKADDRAHLVFLDGSSLSVGPSSALVIDKFVYDPDRKTGEISLTATKGVFRFVGGTISKNNDVNIKTPSASIGIRGGIGTFEVRENGSTTATFYYGTSMTVTGQGQTQTATRHGSQIHIDMGQHPSPPAIIPPHGLVVGKAFEKPAGTPQTAGSTQQTLVRTGTANTIEAVFQQHRGLSQINSGRPPTAIAFAPTFNGPGGKPPTFAAGPPRFPNLAPLRIPPKVAPIIPRRPGAFRSTGQNVDKR